MPSMTPTPHPERFLVIEGLSKIDCWQSLRIVARMSRLHARERGKRARESRSFPRNTLFRATILGSSSKIASTERFITTGENSFHIHPNIPKELTQYLELWGNPWYMWFMKQLRRRLTKALYLLLHSLQWNNIFQSFCVQSIRRFSFQKEFCWSYLSHNGISYGVQIHTAFVSQMKKHVGGLHSFETWDKSNKNAFIAEDGQ